jgi:hypothetical protein
MPGSNNRFHRFGITLGNCPTGEEGRLHALVFKDTKDAPDASLRPIFGLGIFLMVAGSVRQRMHILAALEIEGQRYRDAGAVRPSKLAIVMKIIGHPGNLDDPAVAVHGPASQRATNFGYFVRRAVEMACANSDCIAAVMSPSVVTVKNIPGDAQLSMFGLI